MNTQVPPKLQYSLPSSSGESEDKVSSDLPGFQSAPRPPSGLPQKRKAGRKKFKETRHPFFRGVRERDGGKWVCEVREPNTKSRIWVGTYPTPELAARAYDVAALALRGDKAALNLPNSAWLAPRATSSSARDIRLAALQATRSDLYSSPSPCEASKTVLQEKLGSTSYDDKCLDKCIVQDSNELFVDEETIFNMPAFIDSMAAGMLLTPPSLKRGMNWDEMDVDLPNCHIDLNLWHYTNIDDR